MPLVVQEAPNPDGSWPTSSVAGINGRGKLRPGRTYAPSGGKTATVADDVTNQVTTAPDTK